MGDYQSFSDRPGSSQSDAKLAAIRLPKSLAGKRVLDLGCNEGFFALEAKRRGAARVVGVDHSETAIAAARANAEREGLEVEFIHGDMGQDLSEKFDFILLLSALHYVDEPAAFLASLRRRLSPTGVLVLECGVAAGDGRHVTRALRSIDVRLFPSMELLIENWLDGYAVRRIGRSVEQLGDPIPRQVLHCSRQRPTVVFVVGGGKAGKSHLARMIKDAPTLSVDELAVGARVPKRRDIAPEQARFDELYAASNNSVRAAWNDGRSDAAMVAYFADEVARAIRFCQPAPIVVAEGYMLGDLTARIRKALGAGVRCWTCRVDEDAER